MDQKELQSIIPEGKKEEALAILSKLAYKAFEQNDYIKSIIYNKRYIELCQTNPVIYNTLGYLYRKLSKYQNLEEQIRYFEKSLELKPDYVQALRNLALSYPLVGRHQDAIKCFKKIFELKEEVMDDYVAYGCLLIQLKDFEEGWKYYEYRFKKVCLPTEYPDFEQPRWNGEDIKDKTLLIYYEQGFGDSFQFCRYVNLVKPLTKKIIFSIQNEIYELFKYNFPEIEVVNAKKTRVKELEFDYHIPLMSLVHVLKGTVENIPYTEGYLKAEPEKVKEYKEKYFKNDCLKIGLCWGGAGLGNKDRDVPLKEFLPLNKLKNVKFYAFQKGSSESQLKNLPAEFEVIDLGETFNNFSDTAGAMANLDIFITSDNGVFNLAAALGLNTYLLLNRFPEWRWFLDDNTTPWYKNVKVFKNPLVSSRWDIVLKHILKDIETTI